MNNRAVCVVPIANMSSCRLLRNYESPHSSYDPSLLEAIRATSAMPTLFESVHLGSEGRQEEFISGGVRFNNPIWMAIEEAQNIFGPSRPVSCLLSIGSGVSPPVSLGKQEADMVNLIRQIQTDSQAAAELANKRIGDLGVYFRFSVDRGLEDKISDLGDVTSHSLAYIHTKETSDKLNRCVAIADRSSRVTIGRICTYTRTKSMISSIDGCYRRESIDSALPYKRATEIIGILSSKGYSMEKARWNYVLR